MSNLKILVLQILLLVGGWMTSVCSASENDADPEMELLLAKLNELKKSTEYYELKLNFMKDDLSRLKKKALECERKLVLSCEESRTSEKDVKRKHQGHGNSGTVAERDVIKDNCSCEQCDADVNKLIGKISHYLGVLAECETNKRHHQMLRYFLRKELAKRKEKITHSKNEIGSVDAAIAKDELMAAKYRTELNRLGREHLALLKGHEEKKTQKEKLEEELETCLVEKHKAKLEQMTAEEAFRKKEVTLVTLEEENDSLNKIKKKFKRKVETCREYLKPCLFAIGLACLTEAFLWLRKTKNYEIEANGQIVEGKKHKRKLNKDRISNSKW